MDLGGLWVWNSCWLMMLAYILGAPCDDTNFLIERYQKINKKPNKSGSKQKQIAPPLWTIHAAWIMVVSGGGMFVG